MRQIVLDTETTGLDHRMGDRIIEIGCVELLNRKLTGQRFHRYINPEREVEAGALAVHGLSNEFLQDKPRFGEIVAAFLDFIRGAELIIHNAAFDTGFLDNELALQQQAPLGRICTGIVDTLKMARELHPGRRNSLDALCERYAIDNSGRTLHGALLDAELLAEVYLAMTRGQETLLMELESPPAEGLRTALPAERPALRVVRASAEEQAKHERVLAEIGQESRGNCLWQERQA
ncbi:MAG: DNA polymerase III subunit epsilon [Rhodocyclaceae bacterium]|nr:DNA polymerase III subunit epsilon [Rhodocyclaceae bacterium]MCL4682760.1 DNA polymerase III subunit epsilon [Rhodocyclaceae bacterium]